MLGLGGLALALGSGTASGSPSQGVTFFPFADLSQTALGAYSTRVVVDGYAGNIINLCKVANSTSAGNKQAFAAGGDDITLDEAAIALWAGHNYPQVVTWYDQLGSNHITEASATDRPYLNLFRGTQNDRAPIGFNIFNGPTLDTDGVNNTSNTRLAIPSGISFQRGEFSIAMVIDVPSNASAAAGILGIGTAGGTRLSVMHADGSYATDPGLRIVHSATKSTTLKLKNGRQSVIITCGYGASGAGSGTNYTRVSIDGETVYSSTSAITDATVSGGELGNAFDNATAGSRSFGQFAIDLFVPFNGPLSSADETLIHAYNNAAFGTSVPAGVAHILYYGSSTMQGYRSYNNGFASQMQRQLQSDGYDVVTTGFGRTGQPLATAATGAQTVATYKYANATSHTVIIHGGINDLVTGYTETQINDSTKQAAAAAAIYYSLTQCIAAFRADTSVTGDPWNVICMIQHKRDVGQIAGETANFVTYRYAVLDALATLIKTYANNLDYTWFDPNDDAGIAAYPNTGSRDSDDIHLNETVGIPAAVQVALPVIEAAIDGNPGTSYTYESQMYFAAMTTAPSVGFKADVDTLVAGLKTDSVWNSVDVLYLHRVEAYDQFLNIKSPTLHAPGEVGTPTFTANDGIAYNGTTDAHTLYNASTAGLGYTQNSNHGFIVTLTDVQYANAPFGLRNAATSTALIIPRTTTNTTILRAQDNTGGESIAETNGIGMWAWNRSASNARQLYKNGSAITLTVPTAASVALVNADFRCGGTGGSTPQYVACSLGAVGFGASMNATQHLALYNRINTYLTARANAVYGQMDFSDPANSGLIALLEDI